MKFNSYVSGYQRFKKLWHDAGNPKNEIIDYPRFYSVSLERLGRLGSEERYDLNQIVAENCWWQDGRPYYNFHSSLISTFGRSKLDFPASYIEFPYNAITIQFQENEPLLRLPDGEHYVKSCIVFRSGGVTPIYELFPNVEHNKELVTKYAKYNNRLGIWIDIGERTPDCEIVYTYRHMVWDGPDMTVEEALKVLPDAENAYTGVQIGDEKIALIVKLVVSLAFLTKDESPIIMPHILKKDENTYFSGDEMTRKRLVKKANETRNQIGFLVGSREMFDLGFIGPAVAQPQRGSAEGEELQYANIVNGHWQLFRYGPGKTQGRMRWVMPYVRNKDKPFKHED